MIFHKTKIEGLYIIEPELRADERGYFARVFCKEELAKIGFNFEIVQVNRSLNKKKGIIRECIFKNHPKQKIKLFNV